MENEKKTVTAMIQLYCNENHKSRDILCKKCDELHSYAMKRLESCPYSEEKPPCSKCTTHCYKPDMRDSIKKVMRYAGPRMILHHPILAVDHLIKIPGAELRGICVRRGCDKSRRMHGLHPRSKLRSILARRIKTIIQKTEQKDSSRPDQER